MSLCCSQDSSFLAIMPRVQAGSPIPVWSGREGAGGKPPKVVGVSYLLHPGGRGEPCQAPDRTQVIHHQKLLLGSKRAQVKGRNH